MGFGLKNNVAAPPKVLVKRLLKKTLPAWLLKLRQEYILEKSRKAYKSLSTQQVFTKAYEEGAWGKSTDPKQKFFSGSGSHDANIVDTYVQSVKAFLSSFENKPNVVDLGCGDFFVGSQFRHLCGEYIACDIVEPVIRENKEKYKRGNVDFRILDLTKDELPNGEIVFMRQVLQHLSNDQIIRALPQISSKYKYLVITEHLPSANKFVHNLDKPTNPYIRLHLTPTSGLVLTRAPFNLQVREETTLCEVPELGGIIRTSLYKLA